MKTINNFVESEKNEFTSSVRAFLPHYAVVPFDYGKNSSFKCIVQKNDVVKEGQIIAISAKEGDSIRSYIHSSVPGRVDSVGECFLPNGRKGTAVKIRTEGAFSYLGKTLPETDWQWFTKENFLDLISTKGVLNTFAAPVPLATQISSCTLTKGRFLVVRLFDEDPSRMTDTFVAKNKIYEVLTGAKIIAKTMEARGIVFVFPHKSEIKIDESDFSPIPLMVLETDPQKYPAGYMQNLMNLVKKNAKSTEKVDFSLINRRCIYCDPQTLVSVYDAVVLGEPVVETFVHVTGKCINSSGILKVRVGTSLRELASQCGNFKSKPAKIIINGMVSGSAINSLDTTITREVKSITFVSADELSVQSFAPCVRCGKCRTICPEGLYPDLMFRHSLGGKPVGTELVKTTDFCSGCALCNSVCPSRLPLCQTIELLRKNKDDVN